MLDPNKDTHSVIKVLEEGDYIGEVALVYEQKRTAKVEAQKLPPLSAATSKP